MGSRNLMMRLFSMHKYIISTDSEIGTYQSKEDLWAKMESYYIHEVVDVNKLECRNTRPLCSCFEKLLHHAHCFGQHLFKLKLEARVMAMLKVW